MTFSGRCFAYGVGAGGARGAAKAFEILSREIMAALHQIGCASLKAADRAILADAAPP